MHEPIKDVGRIVPGLWSYSADSTNISLLVAALSRRTWSNCWSAWWRQASENVPRWARLASVVSNPLTGSRACPTLFRYFSADHHDSTFLQTPVKSLSHETHQKLCADVFSAPQQTPAASILIESFLTKSATSSSVRYCRPNMPQDRPRLFA